MSEPEASPRLILQRIRNRVIENLETFASFDEQLAYEQRVPICYVPYEMIDSWEDWVDSPRPSHFVDPVFSADERDAIEKFHSVWDAAATALPDNYPPLRDVQNQAYWRQVRDAAAEALAVFKVRGELSEDVEAS